MKTSICCCHLVFRLVPVHRGLDHVSHACACQQGSKPLFMQGRLPEHTCLFSKTTLLHTHSFTHILTRELTTVNNSFLLLAHKKLHWSLFKISLSGYTNGKLKDTPKQQQQGITVQDDGFVWKHTMFVGWNIYKHKNHSLKKIIQKLSLGTDL